MAQLTLAVFGASGATGQEMIVRASGVAWTVVKPPRLTDGPRTGRVRSGCALRVGLLSSVARAELAALILDAIERELYIRQAVQVSGLRPIPSFHRASASMHTSR